jgi:CheY-like chemotaxis protein
MNGYEAARRIREEHWGREMILVAISGWGQDDDKRRAMEAGFDRHATKPVEYSELQEILALLHARSALTAGPLPDPERPPAATAGVVQR